MGVRVLQVSGVRASCTADADVLSVTECRVCVRTRTTLEQFKEATSHCHLPSPAFISLKTVGVFYTIAQPLDKLCDLGIETVQWLGKGHLP